jgi:trehalose 6-phosphate phosphatase
VKVGFENDAAVPLFDAGLGTLAALVNDNPFLGFDYDGTLAPIVANPKRAFMRSTTRNLFERVLQHFRCAVISGRARDDVAALLGSCEPDAIIGNHGVETGDGDLPPAPLELLAEWRSDLEERLEAITGIVIEHKTYSLTIHYRACADPLKARRAALSASHALESARVIRGIRSLNLLPAGYPTKGSALIRLADRAQCQAAIFIGDDLTDEDAFGCAPDRVLGIRVKATERTAARYYLRDQGQIDDLLRHLIELHARRSH